MNLACLLLIHRQQMTCHQLELIWSRSHQDPCKNCECHHYVHWCCKLCWKYVLGIIILYLSYSYPIRIILNHNSNRYLVCEFWSNREGKWQAKRWIVRCRPPWNISHTLIILATNHSDNHFPTQSISSKVNTIQKIMGRRIHLEELWHLILDKSLGKIEPRIFHLICKYVVLFVRYHFQN